MYTTRFQFHGGENLWETYILADYDILAMHYKALAYFVENCSEVTAPAWGHFQDLPDADQEAWVQIRDNAHIQSPFDMATFRNTITPAIRKHIQTCLQPPTIAHVRGDLYSVKQLMVLRSDRMEAEATWPGVHRNPEVLANLDRAFPAVSKVTTRQSHATYAPLLTEAGVGPLPERYRCRPVPCPRHPGACDDKRLSIALVRSPLSMGQWMAAVHANTSTKGALYYVPYEHHMAVWYLGQPRHLAEPLPEDADEADREDELCATFVQAYTRPPYWQMATVYKPHRTAAFDRCEWWGKSDGGGVDGKDWPSGEPIADACRSCNPCR